MKVYPVQRRLRFSHDESHDEVDEILGVYTTLPAAQNSVHERIGKTLEWTPHNAHGPCWTATDSWWSGGRLAQITNEYGITEHEVQG